MKRSEEKFDEWIFDVSYDDFKNFVSRLNGIIRELPTNRRGIDGANTELSYGIQGVAYLPPYPEQKDTLMKEAFDALKNLRDNEDRATLLYYSIQAIHPFSDGNGRTGRLLYEIVDQEVLDKDSLSKMLDHDRKGSDGAGEGRDLFSKKLLPPNKAYYLINREIVKDLFGEDFSAKYGGMYFSAPLGSGLLSDTTKGKLSTEDVTRAEKILGEGDVYTFSFRDIVLSKLIEEDDRLKTYVYQIARKVEKGMNFALSEDYGKEIFGIDDKIMDALDEAQVRRMIEIHKEVKERFIRTMIDIFRNPDKHIEKDGDGSEYMIKNDFKCQQTS